MISLLQTIQLQTIQLPTLQLPPLLAESASGVYYQFARQESFSEWWQWLLLAIAIFAIIAYVVWMYFKDSVELPTGKAILLGGLRLLALVGILVFFLQLEKRTQKTLVKNSRVLVLVDTSASMILTDSTRGGSSGGGTRLDQVVQQLQNGSLLSDMRKQHDVVVYRFDAAEAPVEFASFPKIPSPDAAAENRTPQQELNNSLTAARQLAFVALCVLLISAIAAIVYWMWKPSAVRTKEALQAGAEQQSYSLLVSIVALIIAAVILGTANLLLPEIGLLDIVGLTKPKATPVKTDSKPDELVNVQAPQWENLKPSGGETRLGDNLKALIDKERGGPVAGVVVFTDGGNNAGVDVSVAGTLAADSLIAVHSVGLGSSQRAINLRVVDLEAPEKVYPGDKFTVHGFVQAQGINASAVEATLSRYDANTKAKLDDLKQVIDVGKNGQVVPIKFEIESEAGTWIYKLSLPRQDNETENVPPAGKPQSADPKVKDNSDETVAKSDNEMVVKVEIVEQKTKILLLAGGPTRDFIFLRNQLYRDEETTVDVMLQSGRPGISQDADEILMEFPSEPDELFEYDAVIAFDPDWESLEDEQVALLERFVAEKGGGLIVVAGPVFTPQWSSRRKGDTKIDTLRNLYPVSFYFQGSATLSLGRFGSDKAWPLNFTREGKEAEFLWIDDSGEASNRAWSQFEGVYGYYAVKDPKPGARVYARFSDPDTALDNELPIYFAGQFYGSGRVFFMASGEMWRVRAVEDAYFESFYTRLIRWVSEGRRLRDSSRGVLLTDKDKALIGDTIEIRAMLQDAQFKPLQRDAVDVRIVPPTKPPYHLELKKLKEAERAGTFTEQFPVGEPGDYHIELTHPAAANQVLLRTVRVRQPALETEKPERDDKLLLELAEKTGGEYFIGIDDALQGKAVPKVRSDTLRSNTPLAELLKPQDQKMILPGTPDRLFDRILMTWLMVLICGMLCVEWTIRRLSKLA